MLSTTSLMVAGAAAADAVARARNLPDLRVGLHLVTIEGPAVLPPALIPLLVDGAGWFGSDQLRLGIRYFSLPGVRRQLEAEIEAQFDAFRTSGLALDHVTAHKHMHLHPTVASLMIKAGRRHGLTAVRIPIEPAAPLGRKETPGSRAVRSWARLLRLRARRAGLAVNDHCFGLAWSGHMTRERLRVLIPRLPAGLSEIYFHPADGRDALVDRLMPDYEHEAELAALTDPALPDLLARSGVTTCGWRDA